MRAVIQRVEQASVSVDGQVCGRIGRGLLVLIAVEQTDGEKDLTFMNRKILNLRVFDDDQGRMNRSIREAGGEILVVSQFTLYGDCRKGNRPSYSRAAGPGQAERLYDRLIEEMRREGLNVASGQFQAMMKVMLVNDGPVTLIVDSPK
jgi:D-aminoacyl-tRNA deacylase